MRSCSVRSRSRTFFFIPFLFLAFGSPSKAQSHDFSLVFGEDWVKAEAFVSENESWIRHELNRYDIPYAEAVAVIFPELMRYSALRDRMETALLKTLYINLGDEYANFSVGPFQMKPSFAEKIRQNVSSLPGLRRKAQLKNKEGYKNIRTFRSEIVKDLEDPRRELIYLIAFIRLCDLSFNIPEGEERILFLATAYNYDFSKSSEEIIRAQDMKFFSTKLVTKELYSYSDISLFWYRKHLSQIKKTD